MQNIVPGTVLGSYTIIRLIGRGGMGEVYETNEQSLDRRVALKVIAREKIGSKGEGDIIRRFLQEARILAQVNHPNVVTIHAIDRYQETQFIAMEYIEGAPFHELFS
ncbi:MAG: serine/threonine protein kinase, partial [Bdellovibrionales bacterium]